MMVSDDIHSGNLSEFQRKKMMEWYEKTYRRRSCDCQLCKADPDPVKTREVPPVQPGGHP